MFSIPASTTRDASPSRQTENIMYLVFEDVVVHIVSEIENRLQHFRYTGNVEMNAVEEYRTNEKIDYIFPVSTVTDYRITEDREVLIARKDGTCHKVIRNCVKKLSVFGGGAMFLLDRYMHQFVTDGSLPGLVETSGLTTDLDIEFDVSQLISPHGLKHGVLGQEYFTDLEAALGVSSSPTNHNEAYKSAVRAFVIEVLREITASPEYIHIVQNKLDFLLSFMQLSRHGAELEHADILNIDGGRGFFHSAIWNIHIEADKIRVNLNMDYVFNGEVHHQHLADIFFLMASQGYDSVIQPSFIDVSDKLVPCDFRKLNAQLEAMTRRYLEVWEVPGIGVHSDLIFRRCSNDRKRFIWYLRAVSHPRFPDCVLTNVKNAFFGILDAIMPRDPFLYTQKQRGIFRTMNLQEPDDAAVLARLVSSEDGLIHLLMIEGGEKLYTPSPMIVRVLRLRERIVAVQDTVRNETNIAKIIHRGLVTRNDIIRGGVRMFADSLETLFRDFEAEFPGSPCMMSETPEAARAIVETYRGIMAHVEPHRWVIRSGSTTSFGRWLGRLFAKRAAQAIRSVV